MTSRVAGVCFIKVDGQMLDLEGTMTINATEVTREAVVTSTGMIGFSETPKAQSVDATLYVSGNFDYSIFDKTDMTITCELATEKVFTLSEAFVSGEPTVDAQAGTVSLTFTGKGVWQ